MSGRQSLIQLQDPKTAERFRKIAQDVKAGRLPITVAAGEFNVSVKTIRRAVKALDQQDQAGQTYREVDKWEQMPGAVEWENKLMARLNNKEGARAIISYVKRAWEQVWNKKLLSLLTADDMAKAVAWAKNFPEGSRFDALKGLRALVRLGFGEHAWLTDFMSTKGTKALPRIPPELKTRETFLQVEPRLQQAYELMRNNGEISWYEYDTGLVVNDLKLTQGARTGDAKEEREVWGTRINAGKSSLIVDQEGQVRHWTVYAKQGTVWEIGRDQLELYPGLLERLERYIGEHDLKTGDYLIRDFDDERALAILSRACDIAGLSHFVLHDFRKIALTSKRLAGVPLEVAVKMGVGWLDIATAAKFYETIKDIDLPEEYPKIRAFYAKNGASHSVPS